jgi:hypothetical protein
MSVTRKKQAKKKKKSKKAKSNPKKLVAKLKKLANPTLADARGLYWGVIEDGGVIVCPCCDRPGKRYKVRFNATMARTLIFMYFWFKAHPKEKWMHVEHEIHAAGDKTDRKMRGDFPKMYHLGLIGRLRTKRKDGSNRVGYWCITEKGRAFVRGTVKVPARIVLYGARCLGLAGAPVSIQQVLASRGFDYAELMSM